MMVVYRHHAADDTRGSSLPHTSTGLTTWSFCNIFARAQQNVTFFHLIFKTFECKVAEEVLATFALRSCAECSGAAVL